MFERVEDRARAAKRLVWGVLLAVALIAAGMAAVPVRSWAVDETSTATVGLTIYDTTDGTTLYNGAVEVAADGGLGGVEALGEVGDGDGAVRLDHGHDLPLAFLGEHGASLRVGFGWIGWWVARWLAGRMRWVRGGAPFRWLEVLHIYARLCVILRNLLNIDGKRLIYAGKR